jgi:hypothetical protein
MATFVIILFLFVQFLFMIRVSLRNAGLFDVMLASLLIKLGLILLIIPRYTSEDSDSIMYFEQAQGLLPGTHGFVELFNAGDAWGTNLIIGVTACILKVAGPSLTVATLSFALPSFWGAYIYYCVFREVFPEANYLYARIVLFLYPSIVFWTAMLGKDGLVFLFLSMVAYGRAKLESRGTATLWLVMLTGIAGCSLIRPHIGALLVISTAASFSFARKGKQKHVARRVASTIFLAIVSLAVVYLCAQLLRLTDVQEAQQHVQLSTAFNGQGSSGFEQSSNPLYRLTLAPLLLVRPFPWELVGAPAALASTEGILLLSVVLIRRKRILEPMKSARLCGFMTYLRWFVALNVLLLALGSSNFGLLARQRTMILPLIALVVLGSFTKTRSRLDSCVGELRLSSTAAK